MNLTSLQLQSLQIPFKVGFKHSSADRKKGESLLASAETAAGNKGMGEGCPRGYVTHEDSSAGFEFFERYREDLLRSIHTFGDLEAWVWRHEVEIDERPAAWCALELAILEALSKDLSQPVEETLGLPPLQGRFQYTAVLGDSSQEVTANQVSRFAQLGFRDFKVKISGNPLVDNDKFAVIQSSVTDSRIRLDGNNLWRKPEEVLGYLNAIRITPFAIEEPLQALDYPGMKALVKQTPVALILDESFLNRSHFDATVELGKKAIINLRVSKMGGLIRSRAIASRAGDLKIPLIIGAHVGETSILTRAALSLANAFRENVLAQEGAFGTHLLESDLVHNPLMFGRAGILDSADSLNLRGTGFGLDYL